MAARAGGSAGGGPESGRRLGWRREGCSASWAAQAGSMGRTRWAVAAFAVTSLLWFPSSILAFQPGKARWPIKTSVPEGADLDHPTRVDLADLIDAAKLPDAPGATKNDAQFQAARIPRFDNPLGVAEGDIPSTVGWLHLVAAEADGDYHIQVSPTHDDDQGTDFLIVEVPTPETE